LSRRIALITAGLVIALLVLAVVPLGLSLTANQHNSFRFDVQSSAHQVAAGAEEYLADHDARTAMDQALADASGRGDCASVFDASGSIVASTPCAEASGAVAAALAGGTHTLSHDSITQDGDWLLVAAPVGDDGNLAGVTVLARSADSVDDSITVVWTWLALTGLGAVVLGIVFARWVGRWVARPLTALGATAARFGDGDLDARAPTAAGPGEVRELASVFNRMAERTQSLVGSHQEWVADVSHQLRTPLTALRLRVDVLADETDDEETAAEMAGLQAEMARLASLVDGLLAVARAEASVPQPEPVRADEIADDRVAAWEPVARERGIHLNAVARRPAVAWLGPGDLEQMLDNLIANALDSVPEGGRVEVSVEAAAATARQRVVDGPAPQRVMLRVVDDGPGMSEQARANAFRRFGRSGTGGNGLGLAIVARLAAANGAEISLKETPGGGLTAVLGLPAVRGART